MNIRNITLSDCEQVSMLLDQLGYETTPKLILSKVSDFSPRAYDEVFVAEDGERILGCISCHITSLFHKSGASGRITSLVIDGSCRGKGVGSSLVEAADRYFLSQGCIQSEVTSGDHRPDAHRFYEAQGYERDERRFIKKYT